MPSIEDDRCIITTCPECGRLTWNVEDAECEKCHPRPVGDDVGGPQVDDKPPKPKPKKLRGGL